MARWSPRVAVLACLVGLTVRSFVAQGPYSGAGVGPMFGDFEAQRHWMEITANLPLKEWYAGQHESNNLTYWGLDYPPLTAYHSWAFGMVFQRVYPEMVALLGSRGMESPETKIWMRFSALLSDAVVFIPSVVLFAYWHWKRTRRSDDDDDVDDDVDEHQQDKLGLFHFLCSVLLSPALILIDHGHFQFNCVCHGLVVCAIAFAHTTKTTQELSKPSAVAVCVLFSLALNFKQMALYYSLGFFVYLLRWALLGSSSLSAQEGLSRLALLGLAVLGTFAVLWGPFLLSNGTGGVLQVLHRVFPFQRGIFEDKVANFWGVTNVLVKWKLVCSAGQLKLLSAALTLTSCAPSLVHVWRGRMTLMAALFCTSLGFFLFAFQVHEKSILLPLVPALLLLHEHQQLFSLAFSLAASFSLFPLFAKDGIAFTALALTSFYLLLNVQFLLAAQRQHTTRSSLVAVGAMCLGFLLTSYLVCVVDKSPIPALPDLFVVAHNAYSFVVFAGFAVYGNAYLLLEQHKVKQE